MSLLLSTLKHQRMETKAVNFHTEFLYYKRALYTNYENHQMEINILWI